MLKRFKDLESAMRRHSIEPAVFVVSLGSDGKTNVMACGWNVKLSYKPPLIGVSLKKTGYTHHLIEAKKQFVIAVPTPNLEKELLFAGNVTGTKVDKLAELNLRTQPADEIEVPILSDARANYECVLEQKIEVGDHFLYVGRIVAAHYDSSQDQLFFVGRKPDNSKRFESIKTTFPDE